MKFYNYLHEKRSHSEQNPKISIIDALLPYKDRDDVYISYTDINKIGINPQSPYQTPLGIYSYPLKEMWGNVLEDTIPFAGNRKYVHCFSVKSKKVQEVSKYSKSQFLKDDSKLEKIYWPLIKEKFPKSVYDNWDDWVYDNIYKHAKFYTTSNQIGKIWWLTKNIPEYITKKPRLSKIESITKWNSILRKDLGYEGFTDKEGMGLVHPSEPIQAIFLSTKPINMIGTFLNKRYDTKEFFDNDNPYGENKEQIKIENLNDLYNIIKQLKKDGYEIKPYWYIMYDAIMGDTIIMTTDPFINFNYDNNMENLDIKTVKHFVDKFEKLLGKEFPDENNIIYTEFDSKFIFEYLLFQLEKSDKNKNKKFIETAKGTMVVLKHKYPKNKDLINKIDQEFKNLNVKWMKSNE